MLLPAVLLPLLAPLSAPLLAQSPGDLPESPAPDTPALDAPAPSDSELDTPELDTPEPSATGVILQLYVLEVTPNAGLDLPPLEQRPAVYAELTLGDQRRTTPAIAPEIIGDSVFPNWGLSARQASPRLAPGHPTQVVIRVFDQDSELEDIIDDKVVQTAIQFDPFACAASINAFDLTGRWQDETTCVLPIDAIESEGGTMGVVLAARWSNAAPGARGGRREEAEN